MKFQNRKRLLIVIPRIPYPLNSGGRIAIYDTIKMLSIKYELVLIIVDDDKSNIKYLEIFRQYSTEIHFFSKSKIYFVVNALKGLLFGMPLQVGYFYFKEVQQLVDSISKSCDYYFSFMIRTSLYGLNLNLKKGLYSIDSMYLNYLNSLERSTSPIWKLIYRIEIPLLHKIELSHISKYDFTTFVNREEALYWENCGNVYTLPHGVTEDILNQTNTNKTYSNAIVFLGRMDYQPNIDAVLWFCNNVLENLNKEIIFYVIGGFPTEEILRLKDRHSNIKILGFVDDPYTIIKSCICTVAPMQSGGGLQTKILMAMALESIVLSTSLPIKAIDGALNKVNIIIEDAPSNFVKIINSIFEFPEEYISIKKASKKLIIENYSTKVVESKLNFLIEKYFK
jgi:glycosyltransferase involved in cell wall biosynthesis